MTLVTGRIVVKVLLQETKSMKQVKIYELTDSGQKEIIVCQTDENGMLTFSGEADYMIEYLIKHGITDYSVEPRGIVMPEDAEKFLEQLQYYFRTGYMTATKPMDI